MTTYNRDTLLKDLKENVCDIQFTKVNGEKRNMRCTLMREHLPDNADVVHLDEQHKKPENLNVIAAWDVQAGGWRSFRIDSVEYAQIVVAF